MQQTSAIFSTTLAIVKSFFFFQAEDGIRDRNVTGVQTCALPICPRSRRERPEMSAAHAPRADDRHAHRIAARHGGERNALLTVVPLSRHLVRIVVRSPCHAARSEERRVGKGRSSGWCQQHYKEKE